MTDRELLENAAKAAGLIIHDKRQAERDALIGPEKAGLCIVSVSTWWNPLTDDGDALRLAVRLRLHAKHFSPLDDDFDTTSYGMVEVWQEDGGDPLHVEYLKAGDDRLVATRRAIVRAAAEIGRNT